MLKDLAANVSFRFQAGPDKDGTIPPPIVCPLMMNGHRRAELTTTLDTQRSTVVVEVQSSRPLTEAIENVWVVPEVQKPTAAQEAKTR